MTKWFFFVAGTLLIMLSGGCGSEDEYEHVVYPDSYQPKPASARAYQIPDWQFTMENPQPHVAQEPLVARENEWFLFQGKILTDDERSKRGTMLGLIYRLKPNGNMHVFSSEGSSFDFSVEGEQQYTFYLRAPRKTGQYQFSVYRSAEKLVPIYEATLKVTN